MSIMTDLAWGVICNLPQMVSGSNNMRPNQILGEGEPSPEAQGSGNGQPARCRHMGSMGSTSMRGVWV